jgi:hypothetical protein
MRKHFVVWSCALLFVLGASLSLLAAEIAADMITKEGKVTRNGKFYLKDNKCRVEKGGTPLYTIVRGDKGLLWEVNGAENTYVEAKLTPAMRPWTEEKIVGESGRKQIGTETIDGHPTKKYEVTVKMGGKSNTYHQWFATDINFPVKMANVSGKWSVEYKNIQKKVAPNIVFDLPPRAVLDRNAVPDVLGGGH